MKVMANIDKNTVMDYSGTLVSWATAPSLTYPRSAIDKDVLVRTYIGTVGLISTEWHTNTKCTQGQAEAMLDSGDAFCGLLGFCEGESDSDDVDESQTAARSSVGGPKKERQQKYVLTEIKRSLHELCNDIAPNKKKTDGAAAAGGNGGAAAGGGAPTNIKSGVPPLGYIFNNGAPTSSTKAASSSAGGGSSTLPNPFGEASTGGGASKRAATATDQTQSDPKKPKVVPK